MSTKTTFKRIALVAVAALGLGVLTSVAPATAAAGANITSLTAGTSAPARVNVAGGTTNLTLGMVTSPTGNDTITAQITSAPATSANAALNFAATAVTASSVTVNSVTPSTKTDQNTAVAGGVYPGVAIASITATATKKNVLITLTADVAGTYQILVTANPATAAGYSTGAVSTSYTVTTSGAPTALTLSSYGGSATTKDESKGGQLFKLTMKDANGNATVLGQNESLLVSSSDTTNVTLRNSAGTADVTSFGSAAAATGTYYVRAVGNASITSTTVAPATLTLVGSGLLPATLTTNATITQVVTSDAPTGATITCTTSTLCLLSTAEYTVSGAAALTVKGLNTSATATTKHTLTVTDSALNTYSSVLSVAATTAAITDGTGTATASGPAVSLAAPAAGLKLVGSTAVLGDVTFAYVAPAASKVAVQGQTPILSATGAKNTFTALVTDQYGVKIANAGVNVSVAGRNTVSTLALGVSDSNGLISYSLTDAGTTGTKDTVTFALVSDATKISAAVINYGTVTVDTVTVSGGSKAETVAGSTPTVIKAGDNGPEGSYVAIKAVVKDASGNLLAGVPVTFTVDAGAIVKTAAIDYATVYTGSDGSASTRVFNWLVGKQTITATAGGKSSTDYLNWVATDATSARVLSATATGDIVSLKVVDRFGNPVQGVTIDLSRTGTGLFGSGKSTDSVTTDKLGTADIRFIGSGTVVAELAADYAQAYDVAGEIAEEPVTAAVAGTTKGTGASFAPAGVAKVSVAIEAGADSATTSAQAAADAAAEATDAANAATDAANAAAEAADAATAAAQDAADAVAALSTQVATYISNLRKQITALTNLVIKIQKKVRA